MKKLPAKLRIKSKVAYELLFVNEFVGDDEQLGECRFDTKQILVNINQSQTELFKTILHEIIHAIALENKLNVPESLTLGLEKGIYQFLKLNKFI